MSGDIIIATIEDREVRAALTKLAAKVGTPQRLLDRIGSFYTKSVRENFDAGKSPDGETWKPLAATTMMTGLAAKKGFSKKGGLSAKGKRYLQGKKVLIASHDLMDHVQHQADNAGLVVGVAGGRQAIPYAAIHQFGGFAGRGRKVKIPARPYLAVNDFTGSGMRLADKDKKMILELIWEWLNQ